MASPACKFFIQPKGFRFLATQRLTTPAPPAYSSVIVTMNIAIPRTVAILATLSFTYSRIMAVAAFRRIREAGYRPILTPDVLPSLAPPSLAGYVGFILPQHMERLRALRVPLVNISQAHGAVDCPSVFPDNRAAGRLAVQHLIERDFRTIYLVHHGKLRYSVLRAKGARAATARTGVRFIEIGHGGFDSLWDELSLPAGIVAADPTTASRVLEIAVTRGAHVPEQLAVIGITDDEIACDTAIIPLSSVDLDPAAIGDRAAALMVRQLAGRRVPRRPVLIPPKGVITRASSDSLATADPFIMELVRFARRRLSQGVRLEDLAQHAQISQRHLNRLFRERTGSTPVGMVQRLAVARAKQLLAESDLAIAQVTAQCGYNSLAYFTTFFHKHTGTTPAAYRKAVRNRPPMAPLSSPT